MANAAPAAAPARHYRVWGTDFRVEATDRSILDGLDRVCGQFASQPASQVVALTVTAVESGGWLIRRLGRHGVERRTAGGAVRHIEWRMVGIAARAEQRMIH